VSPAYSTFVSTAVILWQGHFIVNEGERMLAYGLTARRRLEKYAPR
jgi:hypothetical protein